jgi:hypothetical protein
MKKRGAIVGTAPSWKDTPWDDPSLYIVSLNDAYSLGVPRADAWYDTHPIPKMWFRPKHKTVFKEGDIPDGAYVRPEGHIEWLKERAKTIPVWLQAAPPEDWPANAQRFPFERVREFLKARPDQESYIASSPSMILAHMILEGFTEISIYGIHLATQAEYLKQRPNFEWLLGKAEAMGISIVLPPECPLLKHTHVYGYEAEPKRPDHDALKRHAQLMKQYQKLAGELVVWPRWKSKDSQLAELTRLKALMRDAQQEARHAVISAGI